MKLINRSPNNDTYYIEHNRNRSFRVRKDNKIKISNDSAMKLNFFKKTPSHPPDRLVCKARRSKHQTKK